MSDLPRADWFVYFGVKFKFGLKLCVDYSLRCGKFLASVSGILRYKVVEYEDVFATILIKKCLLILNYGLDCIVLDSHSFNVVSKSWTNARFGGYLIIGNMTLHVGCSTIIILCL